MPPLWYLRLGHRDGLTSGDNISIEVRAQLLNVFLYLIVFKILGHRRRYNLHREDFCLSRTLVCIEKEVDRES